MDEPPLVDVPEPVEVWTVRVELPPELDAGALELTEPPDPLARVYPEPRTARARCSAALGITTIGLDPYG